METGRVVAARSRAAIPVAWTFMSEILTQTPSHCRTAVKVTITFASTVFHGHATDMNVHPAFDRSAIAPKT